MIKMNINKHTNVKNISEAKAIVIQAMENLDYNPEEYDVNEIVDIVTEYDADIDRYYFDELIEEDAIFEHIVQSQSLDRDYTYCSNEELLARFQGAAYEEDEFEMEALQKEILNRMN